MEEQGNGELKLAGVRAGGVCVLEVRGGELARERGYWHAGVYLVLKRTRRREPAAEERERETGGRRQAGPVCKIRNI